MTNQVSRIITDLQELGSPEFKAGLKRFGITDATALGIKIPELKLYAKALKNNHSLALDLWDTKIHEARLLATFIADPKQVNETLMEKWVRDFNSWDICDQVCAILFCKTPMAYAKAKEWTKREPEFEKQAGFALMAALAVHDKKATDDQFIQLFPNLENGAPDDRNFVKKAVNWAIRQIGKRNFVLNLAAIDLAENIKFQESKSAKWIAADALRELKSEATLSRLSKKKASL